jgi:putative addiction module component (TIGR02574 family)
MLETVKNFFAVKSLLARTNGRAKFNSMSATQVLEQIHKLPFEEQREVFEQLRDEFDDELTPEQIAELERRAEDALKNPGRGKPVEQVFAEIEERLLAKE